MSDLKAYLELKKEKERLADAISKAGHDIRMKTLEIESLRNDVQDWSADMKEIAAQMKQMEEDASAPDVQETLDAMKRGEVSNPQIGTCGPVKSSA
jgi:predicted  nucleic acid-binding Zn-ribbon protein